MIKITWKKFSKEIKNYKKYEQKNSKSKLKRNRLTNNPPKYRQASSTNSHKNMINIYKKKTKIDEIPISSISKFQKSKENNNLSVLNKSNSINENNINNKKKNLSFGYFFQYKIMKYNDYELNSLDYNKALKIDKRTYLEFYISLIKIKQKLIFTFYTKDDYNSRVIKICLLFFSFALYYTINALFFNDTTMHKIYEDHGKYNMLYQIPKIIYSTIISKIINILVAKLSLTQNYIISFKKKKKILIIKNIE